jgi:hypothetical protein
MQESLRMCLTKISRAARRAHLSAPPAVQVHDGAARTGGRQIIRQARSIGGGARSVRAGPSPAIAPSDPTLAPHPTVQIRSDPTTPVVLSPATAAFLCCLFFPVSVPLPSV